MTRTPYEAIKEKGVAVLADKLGKKPRTIEMWAFRNRLPRALWPEIMRAFPDLDYDALTALESRQGLDHKPRRAAA